MESSCVLPGSSRACLAVTKHPPSASILKTAAPAPTLALMMAFWCHFYGQAEHALVPASITIVLSSACTSPCFNHHGENASCACTSPSACTSPLMMAFWYHFYGKAEDALVHDSITMDRRWCLGMRQLSSSSMASPRRRKRLC
jgi:hypothetical protein